MSSSSQVVSIIPDVLVQTEVTFSCSARLHPKAKNALNAHVFDGLPEEPC